MIKPLKRNEVTVDTWKKYISAENKAHDEIVKAGYSPQGWDAKSNTKVILRITNPHTNSERVEYQYYKTWQDAAIKLCGETYLGGQNKMIKIDMWYGDSVADADNVDVFFNDLDCKYRGNIYRAGKIIGDYVCADTKELEKVFPHLAFKAG